MQKTSRSVQARNLHQRIDSQSTNPTSTLRLPSNGEASSMSRRPLNNAKTDVIIKLETLPDASVKVLFRVIYVAVVAGVLSLAVLMTEKFRNRRNLLHNNSVLIWNTAISCSGLISLVSCSGVYFRRLYIVNKRKLNWSPRRRKGAILFSIELTTQLVNLCGYLAPNAHVLINECGWHDTFISWMGFVRMTCWNTLFLLFLIYSSNHSFICNPGEGPAEEMGETATCVIDRPLIHHTPKLILWMLTEGLLLGLCTDIQLNDGDSSYENVPPPCTGSDFICRLRPVLKNITIALSTCFIIYFLGSVFYFRQGFRQLRNKQYLNYRLTNILIRLQLRMQLIVHVFHMFSFSLLWFVRINTCASFALSWFGFLPSQLATTAILCVKCYLFIPLQPANEDFTLEMWLREHSWSENESPDIPEAQKDNPRTIPSPRFVFERAVKTLYWSTFIYDYKQVPDSKMSITTAMYLYDLTEYELFHENLHDTKLLVAWNDRMALLAFRGTSSLKNLLADLRFTRVVHPPKRGHYMTRPMVHRGFLETWTSNDLNLRVLELMERIQNGKKDFRFLLTGHSLGGAVAILAAYDIRVRLNVSPCCIDCYTFGAPRVGNYPFAHDFNAHVPNTWNVINDQDYVTRTMKFLGMYKRPGQRVIINSKGDMLVRPSFIEMSLSRTTGAVNLAQHLLGSYQKAFLSIAKAQFSEDSIEGGYEGMLGISTTLRHVLGVSKASLIREQNWGHRIKQLEIKKKADTSRIYGFLYSTRLLAKELRQGVVDKIENVMKQMQNPRKQAAMDGICIDTTHVCGGEHAAVTGIDCENADGLCLEVGHVSLEEQRFESSKDFSALELGRNQQHDFPATTA